MGRIRKGITKREQDIINYISNDFLTVKEVSSTLNISVQAVYKVIRKLEKEGVVFKSNSGLKVIKEKVKVRDSSQKVLNHNSLSLNEIRLHNIELRLVCLRTDILSIKSKVINNKEQYQTNIVEHTGSIFFKIKDMVYFITKKDYLYMQFPENYSIYGHDAVELRKNLNESYSLEVQPLENMSQVVFYKPNRHNYDIVNQHQELVNNEVAADLNKNKIANEVVSYDKEDGKVAYNFDLSNKVPNMESPHSVKADNYIYLATKFMDFLRDRKMQTIIQNYDKLKEFLLEYETFKKEHALLKESSLMFLEQQSIINKQPSEEEQSVDKPSYIG